MKRSFLMRQCAVVMSLITPLTLGMGPAPKAPRTKAETSVSTMTASSFEGRELYIGMYFGVGPAAPLFPEIWESEQIRKYAPREGREAQFEEAAAKISEVIASKDPEFFQRFAEGVQSRDHLLIEKTLKEARDQTHHAVAIIRGIPVESVADLVRSHGASPVADVWLYQETAVAAIAVAVVVVVAFAIDFTPLVDTPNPSRLQMEAWVDTLAQKEFGQMAR